MKKKYLFLLPVFAMLLAGCNKSNAPVESKEDSPSTSISTSTSTSSQTSSSGDASSQDTSSQDTSSGDVSSEETSSEEQSSQDASSEETSSEEQSSEEQSSEESSSQDLEEVVAISVDDARTILEENKDAVIDTENGQIAEYTATLTNLVKDQVVTFFYFGAELTEDIGSDTEDETHKNLVQGEVGNFVIHNNAETSDVTFKVYEDGFAFWLTGYVADTPEEDSFKLFIKDSTGDIRDFDMAQNTEKLTEYYRQGVEVEAGEEVFFCITINQIKEWYHYSDVQNECIDLVEDSPAYIHEEEEDERSDHNLAMKHSGTYDFYVDTAKDKDTNQAIWIEEKGQDEEGRFPVNAVKAIIGNYNVPDLTILGVDNYVVHDEGDHAEVEFDFDASISLSSIENAIKDALIDNGFSQTVPGGYNYANEEIESYFCGGGTGFTFLSFFHYELPTTGYGIWCGDLVLSASAHQIDDAYGFEQHLVEDYDFSVGEYVKFFNFGTSQVLNVTLENCKEKLTYDESKGAYFVEEDFTADVYIKLQYGNDQIYFSVKD